MNKLKYINLLLIALLLFSCGNAIKNSEKPCYGGSFEINGRDTFNLIDCHGWKQGKWVPSIGTNKLKDTLYYKNDTLISGS